MARALLDLGAFDLNAFTKSNDDDYTSRIGTAAAALFNDRAYLRPGKFVRDFQAACLVGSHVIF